MTCGRMDLLPRKSSWSRKFDKLLSAMDWSDCLMHVEGSLLLVSLLLEERMEHATLDCETKCFNFRSTFETLTVIEEGAPGGRPWIKGPWIERPFRPQWGVCTLRSSSSSRLMSIYWWRSGEHREKTFSRPHVHVIFRE